MGVFKFFNQGPLLRAVAMLYHCAKRSFWVKASCMLLSSLLPLANLYVLKLLVDAISVHQPLSSVLILLLAFASVFLLLRLVSILDTTNDDFLSQRLVDYVSEKIHVQSVRLDMSYFDSPEYHDMYQRAQLEAGHRPFAIVDHFSALLGAFFSVVGIAFMLASASWLIVVVMVLAVLPSFFVRLRKARNIYRFRKENTSNFRRASYFSALLTNRDYAKEIRCFSLSELFQQRFRSVRGALVASIRRLSLRMARYDLFCALIETAALLAVVFLLIHQTYSDAITIGSFVMLFDAFRRGQKSLGTLVSSSAALYDSRLFVSNLYDFLALEPSICSPKSPLPFPDSVSSIVFSHVSFRYPDMSSNVLSDFSLSASLGSVTYLKGNNGFGKSSLVKLLLRLYECDNGSIFINGIDIRRFDLIDLRRHIGVLFQDFVRYYTTATENVLFGDLRSNTSDSRLNMALRLSGADSVWHKLSKGGDTQLGRMFDGGEELSMGQWQRLALARQLYTQAPILVFDEPTAWLDKVARSNFYATIDYLKTSHIIILICHEED